jgi:hypothetical protein
MAACPLVSLASWGGAFTPRERVTPTWRPCAHRMATLRAAVEATLLGKDERLVAKCKQLTDWSRATPSPFAIGAFLATAAIPPQAVVKTTERAPAAGKRQVQGVQGRRRWAARVQLLHRRLPQLGSVPGRGTGGQ